MKQAIVLTTLILVSALFVACSKDKGGGGQEAPQHPGQYSQQPYDGSYNHNTSYCRNGQIPSVPYTHYYQGQPLQNSNCLNQNQFQGYRPYYIRYNIGFNVVRFVGTCNANLPGVHCPPGYACQPYRYSGEGFCASQGNRFY